MLTNEYEQPMITSIEIDPGVDHPILVLPIAAVVAVAAGTWVVAVVRATRAVKKSRFVEHDQVSGPVVVTLPALAMA